MAKRTLQIFQCSHRKILRVCLTIFQKTWKSYSSISVVNYLRWYVKKNDIRTAWSQNPIQLSIQGANLEFAFESRIQRTNFHLNRCEPGYSQTFNQFQYHFYSLKNKLRLYKRNRFEVGVAVSFTSFLLRTNKHSKTWKHFLAKLEFFAGRDAQVIGGFTYSNKLK